MTTDTIVALATPAGVGATALIRLSGPEAGGILQGLAPELEGLPEPRRATLATLRDPEDGEVLDRALVTWFPGPDSYTGEDVVELSTHGGWWTPAQVVDVCRALGARGAEAGEFTRRAYLHGKLDLLQVEAVADLVDSRSSALHRAATETLDGGLSRRIGSLREGLVALEARLAHHLDFPEEDDAPVPLEEVARQAKQLEDEVRALLATAPEGVLLREGAVTVLAGPPNAGKSALYNALVGERRALVTEVPGTTRDALESVVELGGYPFRLVDTAGLRETEDRVERLGIEVAWEALGRADLVLYCREWGDDSAVPPELRDELGDVLLVPVRTKADRAGDEVRGPHNERTQGEVWVSAESGEGLDGLRDRLVHLVFGGLVRARGEPVLTRRRQVEALRAAAEQVGAFAGALGDGVPADVAATHLGAAGSHLEELVGIVTVNDVLDVVFASFCIGK